MKTSFDVAILGCGPAGLLAALAVEEAGHRPVIYSRKTKSVIPGSVYLHEAVPGLTSVYPENHVQYIRMGTAEGYARKVYGDGARMTGWENYFQIYPSWNAVSAYDKLWERFFGRIVDKNLEHEMIREIVLGHEATITTLPISVTCFNKFHQHDGTPYWIKTLPAPPLDVHRDIVIYNGLYGDAWYRWSVLSGICSIESTMPMWDPADPTVKTGIKATESDCDCWPSVHRAGRWAQWRHGVLLNDAYKTAKHAMQMEEVLWQK